MNKFKGLTAILLAGVAIFGSAGDVSAESDTKRNWEIQFDYLHWWNKSRKIDNYNVHLLQKSDERGNLTFYRGVTLMYADGYTNRYYAGVYRDSDAFGVGPAAMFRWNQNISGKLYVNWDACGSLLVFNKAHPAQGRAYGFLWRTGPSITWKYEDDDSFTFAGYISHVSNGMRSHNPGYNTRGFSVGVNHKF